MKMNVSLLISTTVWLFSMLFSSVNSNVGSIDDWKMTERFFGCRFEVFGKVQRVGFRKAAQLKADELGCFGWIQNTKKKTVVGELRCSKRAGPLFLKWLEDGPELASVDKVDSKIYEDTKIKLHFSYFRILDNQRKTCFTTSPHSCVDLKNMDKLPRKDEL